MPATPPMLKFTQESLQAAHDAWGANCGPASLAACCGAHIYAIRGIIPNFERVGYTNCRMMAEGLQALGFRTARRADFMAGHDGAASLFPDHGLVRLQLGGPWTQPGASPRWASTHTHWIATKSTGPDAWVFDANGGWMTRTEWECNVVPALVEATARADGTWWPTHRWEVRRIKTRETRP